MLDAGFTKAFKENRVGDIKRFFQLAKRCGGGSGGGGHETITKTTKDQREALASTLTDASNSSTKFVDAVRRAFGVSLRSLGTEIVKDEQREKDMVMRLLTLKSLADDAVHRAFESGETFVATSREAFEHFVNQRGNKPPELIAKFVDSKLRASSAKAAGTSENDSSSFVAIDHDAETEKALDGALSLFRHVQGKDAFEAFYKRDLAKRLLLGKSASVDAEKSFIGKLKAECGAQFTAKLEGMFKDVDASRDLMRAYNESLIGLEDETKRRRRRRTRKDCAFKRDRDVRERVNRGFVAHVHRADVAFTASARTRSRRVRVVLPRQSTRDANWLGSIRWAIVFYELVSTKARRSCARARSRLPCFCCSTILNR
jgi:hypothetical protein